MIRTLYLAGPDVFRPDAAAHAERLKALCAAHGFEGLFPLDAQVGEQPDATPADKAAWIYRADIGLLDRADAVLVNLPDPARYGLHKLIVAHERGARHPKHGKDIAQALALIDWHLQRAPHALADAWAELAANGAGWVKRARASLAQAPKTQAVIVHAFEEIVGLRK